MPVPFAESAALPYFLNKTLTVSCISLCVFAIASSNIVVQPVLAQDLLPPIKLQRRLIKAETTTIVYYANETDPKSVNQLADWLAKTPDEAFQKAARNLRSDAKMFPAVVKREIAQLMAGVSADQKLALVVFTNEDARQGRFRWLGLGATKFEFVAWLPTASKLKVFRRHPLAHPANFEKALQSVGIVADAAKTDFVLIAKSHGTPRLAVAQGFAPMFEANSPETLMAILDQIKAAADTTKSSDDLLAKSNVQLELEEQLRSEVSPSSPHFKFGSSEIVRELKRQAIEDSTLDVNDGGTLDPNADSTLDVNDGSTLGATNASKYFSEGISKQRFLETVIRMGGAKKMYFDTIFIESCKSELPRTSIKVLKSLDRLNIGTLFVSDAAGLRYETIDYAKLFANSDGRTFSDSLNSFMRQVQKEHAKEGLPKVDR